MCCFKKFPLKRFLFQIFFIILLGILTNFIRDGSKRNKKQKSTTR